MDVPYTVTVPGTDFSDMYVSIAHFLNNYQMVTDRMGVHESEVGVCFVFFSLFSAPLSDDIGICIRGMFFVVLSVAFATRMYYENVLFLFLFFVL